MLTVKTYLAPSKIHGIGLFASEDIPAQTIIWEYNEFIDRVIPDIDFLRTCRLMNGNTLNHLLNSSYKRNGRYFYLTDNARFINHSETDFNISFRDDFSEVSIHHIPAHQELLENYFLSYDPDDYFCVELLNPDPNNYLNLITPGEICRAHG